MESARWEQVQAIFHEAVALAESEREAYLRRACDSDAALLMEVRAMLVADNGNASLLDRGLPDVAFQILNEPPESVSPREFGPYRLIRILGEGGMGVVWLAERADAGNRVAIKFLPHAGLSPARRERFTREIKTLAKLKHPFIARLYDAGTLDNGTPWFVMEYVDGVRFNEYYRRPGRSFEENLRIFRSVCEAVQYAHSQEIIHRDLKPSNILVEADGTPRLLDFGIARELQSLDHPDDQTRPGLRFMSPHYAAPEWVRDGTIGFFTDVYSLGVILYEMLTGQLPFVEPSGHTNEAKGNASERVAEKPSVVAARHTGTQSNGTPPQLSKAAWSDLDVLCLKAMHQDAHQRYQSVEALIRDLDHYLKQEPLEARPDTFQYRLSKFLKRNRRSVLAAAAVVILVVGLVVFFTVRLARARNAALAEAARTQRIQQFMVNLLSNGDQEAAPSGDLRVLDLLVRGEKEADSLNGDPETQARLYEILGSMYDMLGKFDKSDELLLKALNETKSALGSDHIRVAEMLVHIGILRGDRNQFKDAEGFVQQGLDLASRQLPPDDPAVIEAKSALGRVTAQSGAYQKAIAILEPLSNWQPRGEEGPYTLRDTLIFLGASEYAIGNYETSESLIKRALIMDQQLFGARHPRTAESYMNLGVNEFSQGRYSEAEKQYRHAMEIYDAWYGPDHPDTATATGLVARALLAQGKYGEAEGMLQQVLKSQEKAYGKADGRIAVTLDSLGRIAVQRNDLDSAEASFNRALEIDRSLFGEKNYQTAVMTADLADVYMRKAQYVEAEAMLRRAVDVLSTTLSPTDSHTVLAQARLGRALLHDKRYNDAEKQLTDAYAAMQKMPNPPPSQIRDLRQDLAAVYIALKQPENAKKFQAELASADLPKAGASSAK